VQVAGLGESLDEIAQHVESLCAGGGCGAVIVNTVDRAQQLYLQLRERLAGRLEPMLFHARYPGDERQRRERRVLATFGRDAQRPRAALLVATQVVEQSLDLDFDFLVSDLAPVDLLLQRAGRLHRHNRERPLAHREPQLTVAGLAGSRLPDLKATMWVPVYDEWLLLRSWAVARAHDRWALPHDIDRLVQWVYSDTALPPGTPAEVARRVDGTALGSHLGETQQELQRARNAVLDAIHLDLGEVFAGKPRGNDEGSFPGVRNVTRLGPDSVVAISVEIDGDRWRVEPGRASFDPAAPITDPTLARRLVERQVRLSRRELVQALAAAALPASFAEHPWLRHCRPLPLAAGCGTFGGLTVRLDPELGIVYNNGKENAPDAQAPGS
jgi:CRISPR-associated endonuclease/helicase Cas3